ncbi:9580_t:CDS:2 [Entrophospora sp. SA101]|nr:9580_t:CDS:2 [Entrophospora sp. SA101]
MAVFNYFVGLGKIEFGLEEVGYINGVNLSKLYRDNVIKKAKKRIKLLSVNGELALEPIVPNHQVFVVVENFFELNEVPFVLDPDDIDNNDGSSLENNMNDEVGESNEDCTNDYDLDDVVQNYVD